MAHGDARCGVAPTLPLESFTVAGQEGRRCEATSHLTSSEKVVDRKIEHRYPVSDPQFRREMSVLLGPTILRGNHVTALQNGKKIFPAMLLAIRSAQSSITLETFIYWSDDIGEEFSQALSERARAGVPVNVIVD